MWQQQQRKQQQATTTMTTQWKLIDAAKAKNINTGSPSSLSLLWNHENNNNHHRHQHYHNYIVCPTTDVYRKLAVSITTTTTEYQLNRVVRILEIGCCTGQTTELFIKGGKISPENVLAVDISSTFIEQCQTKFNNDNNTNNNNNNSNNNIQFEQIDVLLEWARLEEIIRTKWGSKKEQRKNNENENEEQQSNKSAATDLSSDPNYNINNDDLLEHQMNIKNEDDNEDNNEELVVFIDIGGNREIESVLAIIQAFMLLPMRRKDKNNKQQFDQSSSSSTTSLLDKQPMIMVVKSQALYDYGVIHGPNSLNDWDTLQNLIQKQLLQRRRIQRQHKQGPSKEDDVQQQDSAATTEEQQQASQKSHWRYHRHPLKIPQRYIISPGEGEGEDDVVTACNNNNNNNKRRIAICRYHNYDKQNGCLLYNDPNKIRGKKVCLLDHDHCHYCLKRGHIALDCPMFT